jgi:hypothetical protein
MFIDCISWIGQKGFALMLHQGIRVNYKDMEVCRNCFWWGVGVEGALFQYKRYRKKEKNPYLSTLNM